MLREAAGALEKSKNQEWPFAGVSGSALDMVCDRKFAITDILRYRKIRVFLA